MRNEKTMNGSGAGEACKRRGKSGRKERNERNERNEKERERGRRMHAPRASFLRASALKREANSSLAKF